jgi:hypothetical protein
MIPARPKAPTPVCEAALFEVAAAEAPDLVVLEPAEGVELPLLVVVPDDSGDLGKTQCVN